MFIDIMDVDALQYASISMEMLKNKSFLEVYHRGQDYLDKPPLLFWLSSLSYLVFGINNLAYKLPSVLVLILGVYSTYRFAYLWYDKRKALFAALILASSQAFMLMTNDVKTDGLLTGFVIFSVWQLSAFLKNGRWKNLLLASVGIAGALMSKGPLGLVIPVMAFTFDFVLKRQWRQFLKWEWLVLAGLVLILLLPMCYGLYQQFDMHPEKEVYGLHGPSGLKFFFWTQSFGRITGDIYWKNSTGFFYFFHTILWDFQPWIGLFILALVYKLIDLVNVRFLIEDHQEVISMGGFLLAFLALSTSNFKLPHYIFPLLPFASVMVSEFLFFAVDRHSFLLKRLCVFQFSLMHLFFILAAGGLFFVFPPSTPLLYFIVVVLFALFWMVYRFVPFYTQTILTTTIIASVCLNVVMSTNFYPQLLKYQPSNEVGRYVKQNPGMAFYHFQQHNNGLDVYANKFTAYIQPEELDTLSSNVLLYTNQTGLQKIGNKNLDFEIIKEFDEFHVSTLSLPFLMKDSRNRVVNKRYLLKIK